MAQRLSASSELPRCTSDRKQTHITIGDILESVDLPTLLELVHYAQEPRLLACIRRAVEKELSKSLTQNR